ncbi:phospholipase D-like domain-containing protein [Sphingomonas silueang]|uniref:phospholipase D-like domain-containing protein n=1 Tax=Sphingomonas silueang TaxID=3156617 RepID=UPI0032B31E1D
MRILDDASRFAVRQVIDQYTEALRKIPGFVAAEPGFPVVDGEVLLEPAVLVFVDEKKSISHLLPSERAPRQLGPYRVAVMQADPERQVAARADELGALLPELSSEDLTYEGLPGDPIDQPHEVTGKFLCHAGPDAGWPVLKTFLLGTRERLTAAMYDFNAGHVIATFIDTVRALDVPTTLTWDDGMTPAETAVRQRLRQALGQKLDGWIVRCGGGRRFASAYHEKVAVRDSRAFWLSSGNWSWKSQPDIDPIARPADARSMFSRGNREWHVIVDDKPLSELFERYIRHDRDGSEAEQQAGAPGVVLGAEERLAFPDLFVPLETFAPSFDLAVPEPAPPATLPSASRSITVQPLLSPDNYLARVRELIASAERSLYLQFSYITWSAAQRDRGFTELLRDLAERSYAPGLDLRIIVGNNSAPEKIRRLVEAGFNPRVFRVQTNVHNKGIIADGERVLVSSANWSSDGVLRNRDAGIVIHDAEIAAYYQAIFLDDWDNRARARLDDGPPVRVAGTEEPTPRGMVRVSWADYFG